jgi:hypothetical protein
MRETKALPAEGTDNTDQKRRQIGQNWTQFARVWGGADPSGPICPLKKARPNIRTSRDDNCFYGLVFQEGRTKRDAEKRSEMEPLELLAGERASWILGDDEV